MSWELIRIPWLRCPECHGNLFRICGDIKLSGRVINVHSIYCGNLGCNHVWKLRNSRFKMLKISKVRRRIIRKAIHA